MVNINFRKIVFILVFFVAFNAHAQRLQIRSVGSTTVYPFSIKVANEFAQDFNMIEPIIEGTGTGQGMKLFCSPQKHNFTPDITGASREIKESEIELCRKNGVGKILEVPIGYDGIILAIKTGIRTFNITLEELFLAAAKQVPNKDGKLIKNPYKKWHDINPRLPNVKIQILLPQVENGTYGSFLELAMDKGCALNNWMRKLNETSPEKYTELCRSYRQDGGHVITATKYDLGDSHDLFVQKIYDTPGMLGVMGYSFLNQFRDKITAIPINGIKPSYEKISSQEYPLSRLLYIYVRKDRLGLVQGLQKFIDFYHSQDISGDNGILTKLGLVPFPLTGRPEIKTL